MTDVKKTWSRVLFAAQELENAAEELAGSAIGDLLEGLASSTMAAADLVLRKLDEQN